MWEKSEKHLALGLLFAIAANPVVGVFGFLLTGLSLIHLGLSTYYGFKEGV